MFTKTTCQQLPTSGSFFCLPGSIDTLLGRLSGHFRLRSSEKTLKSCAIFLLVTAVIFSSKSYSTCDSVCLGPRTLVLASNTARVLRARQSFAGTDCGFTSLFCSALTPFTQKSRSCLWSDFIDPHQFDGRHRLARLCCVSTTA